VPIILATLEAEIRKIVVKSQPRQKVQETPSQPIAGCSNKYLIPATAGNLIEGL
jgi:hypothetical protein